MSVPRGARSARRKTGPTPGRPPARLARRLVQLYVGLVLYGASAALMVVAGLGLSPWDVFHQGASGLSGLSIGTVSILTGAVVLLLWLPLRQRPGLGTVSNVAVVGLAMDATLRLVPAPEELVFRVPLLVAGVVLNGVATGLYITARFGPGPRDGLMTGLHQATGRSVRLVRTGIELIVLTTGFLLGGSLGVGTVLYAVAIGPLAQFFLRWCAIPGVGDPGVGDPEAGSPEAGDPEARDPEARDPEVGDAEPEDPDPGVSEPEDPAAGERGRPGEDPTQPPRDDTEGHAPGPQHDRA